MRDKKLLIIFACFMGFCLLCIGGVLYYYKFAKHYRPITDYDFLKASGKMLQKDHGKGPIVYLRGVNAGGYLLQEMWMTPTNKTQKVKDESSIYSVLEDRFGAHQREVIISLYQDVYWRSKDFDNIRELGFNVIRLPFWYRNLVDENYEFYGYDANADDPYAKAFERLDWFIQESKKRGLYVILDCHGAPGSQNGSDHSGTDGGKNKEEASKLFFGEEAKMNQERFYSIWEVIAARYANEPAVAGYDLLNEPFCEYVYSSSVGEDELHRMLWDVYDEAYNRVRAVDPEHTVIMEGIWRPTDLPDPDEFGWTNVMYEYHQYERNDDYNSQGKQIKSMNNLINAINRANYNVPSYIGEFSYFNNLSAWQEGMALLNMSDLNWSVWTYKTLNYYGNWGLYHHSKPMSAGLDLENCDLNYIKFFYSCVGKSTKNKALTDVLTKYTK